MANSLLLQEGTGIAYERRQEIVFDAHASYVDQFPIAGLESHGFTNTSSFDNITLDFDSRLTPEDYAGINVRNKDFASFANMQDRFTFLRGVASSIVLSEVEVEVCAELLGVRPAVLQAAIEPKPARERILSGFLIALDGQMAS